MKDEEKIDDKEKMQAILKGLKYMKESCEQLNIKLNQIENEQELEHKVMGIANKHEVSYFDVQDQLEVTEKIDELGVKLHEIRQVTGARCLSDGHSAAALISSMNRSEKLEKMMEVIDDDMDSIEDDLARKDSFYKGEVKKTRQ